VYLQSLREKVIATRTTTMIKIKDSLLFLLLNAMLTDICSYVIIAVFVIFSEQTNWCFSVSARHSYCSNECLLPRHVPEHFCAPKSSSYTPCVVVRTGAYVFEGRKDYDCNSEFNVWRPARGTCHTAGTPWSSAHYWRHHWSVCICLL